METPDGLHRSMDYQIWVEFSEKQDHLSEIANALKTVSKDSIVSELNGLTKPVDSTGEEEFPEGKTLTRIHNYKERNPKAVQKRRKHL